MGIVAWIVVGLIAGWLAGMVMKGGGYGLVGDLVLGVIGAIVGGWLGSTFLGLGVSGINIESILVAAVGAIIVVFASRLVRGRRSA
jgi:uncharacterized membrane protein YeaQ/YmgE (transglycosylase-associated protein family)